MSFSNLRRTVVLLLLLGVQGPALAQSDPVAAGIQTLVNEGGSKASALAFYRRRDYGPVWSGSEAAEERMRRLLTVLSHTDQDGLDPERYRITAAADPAARDVTITSTAPTYMQDLAAGRRDLEQIDLDVALPPHAFDDAAALDTALRQNRLGDLAADLAPRYPEYARLKSALVHYRAIAAQGGWPVLAAGSDFLGKDAGLLMSRLNFEDGQRVAKATLFRP